MSFNYRVSVGAAAIHAGITVYGSIISPAAVAIAAGAVVQGHLYSTGGAISVGASAKVSENLEDLKSFGKLPAKKYPVPPLPL
jgi:hypothetical protein